MWRVNEANLAAVPKPDSRLVAPLADRLAPRLTAEFQFTELA